MVSASQKAVAESDPVFKGLNALAFVAWDLWLAFSGFLGHVVYRHCRAEACYTRYFDDFSAVSRAPVMNTTWAVDSLFTLIDRLDYARVIVTLQMIQAVDLLTPLLQFAV